MISLWHWTGGKIGCFTNVRSWVWQQLAQFQIGWPAAIPIYLFLGHHKRLQMCCLCGMWPCGNATWHCSLYLNRLQQNFDLESICPRVTRYNSYNVKNKDIHWWLAEGYMSSLNIVFLGYERLAKLSVWQNRCINPYTRFSRTLVESPSSMGSSSGMILWRKHDPKIAPFVTLKGHGLIAVRGPFLISMRILVEFGSFRSALTI